MNNRILLLLSNLNSQFGNTLLTTQHMEEPESLPSCGQPDIMIPGTVSWIL